MRKASSAIFTCKNKIFYIERQNYLPSFPGYVAFPGGKVDKEDDHSQPCFQIKDIPKNVVVALEREIYEELGFNIQEALKSNIIKSVRHIGNAVTPKFNPYRFDTYFFKIELTSEVKFKLDSSEFKYGEWIDVGRLLEKYNRGEIIAVPPTVKLIKKLAKDINRKDKLDLSLDYDDETMVPMIEPIRGVKQFLPLSNTLPPADRTNCFLIGEEDGFGVLIDPSPKDEQELSKLYQSITPFAIKRIFLTHSHPDHHEYAPHIAKSLDVPIKLSRKAHLRICDKFGEDYFEGVEIKYAKEGDVITSSLGQEIIVYEVPGHDEGQLALASKNMNWMIVGDLIQGIGTVVIGEEEGDMTKYMDSLQKVIDLDPKVIFPSHGIGLGGTNYIQKTLEHRVMREGQIKSLLTQGKTEEEILKDLYSEVDERLHKYALMNIKSHIKKIQNES